MHLVQLLPGLGNHHHPIATKSPEAQKFFDQGLALAWAFNRAEAERSFRRAAELDPSAAMPWWGVSLALGRHLNMDLDQDVDAAGAFSAIEKARSLMASAPENEKAYIEALGKRCSGTANQDGARLDDEYASAMRLLAARYPDDLDAKTLFADSLFETISELNPERRSTSAKLPRNHSLVPNRNALPRSDRFHTTRCVPKVRLNSLS